MKLKKRGLLVLRSSDSGRESSWETVMGLAEITDREIN